MTFEATGASRPMALSMVCLLAACVPTNYVPIDVQIARNNACQVALADVIRDVRQIESDLAVVRELEARLSNQTPPSADLDRTAVRRMELEIKLEQAVAKGEVVGTQCEDWRDTR